MSSLSPRTSLHVLCSRTVHTVSCTLDAGCPSCQFYNQPVSCVHKGDVPCTPAHPLSLHTRWPHVMAANSFAVRPMPVDSVRRRTLLTHSAPKLLHWMPLITGAPPACTMFMYATRSLTPLSLYTGCPSCRHHHHRLLLCGIQKHVYSIIFILSIMFPSANACAAHHCHLASSSFPSHMMIILVVVLLITILINFSRHHSRGVMCNAFACRIPTHLPEVVHHMLLKAGPIQGGCPA